MLFNAIYESQYENSHPKQNREYNTRDHGAKNKRQNFNDKHYFAPVSAPP